MFKRPWRNRLPHCSRIIPHLNSDAHGIEWRGKPFSKSCKSTCAPWRMCMYFLIQGRLFPWRVRVFLKASITTSWPTACTSLCKCMCPFRISACTSLYKHVLLYISTCTPWRMCMYYHIQGHLFPWRVRVFLKAGITTSWPTASTSLYKCMCSFRISICTPLYKHMCSLAYVHVLPYSRPSVPLACSCVSQSKHYHFLA